MRSFRRPWAMMTIVAVFPFVGVAASAQAPKVQTAKPGETVPLWGKVIDPDGDCQFFPGKTSFTINVPKTRHDLGGGKYNAPRVMQEVEGDFEATVRIPDQPNPKPPSTRDGGFPFHGAGLLVWLDDSRYFRLERAGIFRDGYTVPYLLYQNRDGGDEVAHDTQAPQGEVWLRLTRQGKKVRAEVSNDGKKWAASEAIEVDWPSKLDVGISASSTGSNPFSVRFAKLDVKKPQASK